jgi:hypothetical protein
MQGWSWVLDNWMTVINAVGVIGGLFLTARALRSETKTRRIANLLTVTTNHREVWKAFFEHPELARVLDASANLAKKPITPGEQRFVNMVVNHISSVYESLKDELVTKQEGLRQDVRSFFSLPLPRAVWEKTKIFQNADFVKFVEMCRTGQNF